MLRLLHIEDSPLDARLIERHLRQQGLDFTLRRVDARDDLLDALAAPMPWDAVLTDYNLPALPFAPLLALLRHHVPDCPVLLVSGSVGEEAAVDLLREGVWDFVLKDNLTRLVPVLERSFKDRDQRLAARLAEQELLRHREHLAELVAQRTRELEAARTHAERLTRVKSEFLAHMSHEVRTPLNGVLGLARIGWRDSVGHPVHGIFGDILESGQILLALVNDILDFSKIEAGKLQLEARAYELGAVLRRATSFSAERAAAKGIGLQVQVAQDVPAVLVGDALRVEQVLTNLLSNAVKFTHRGSVTLAVQRHAGHLLMRVSDTGIGMTAEHCERVFAPFEQADTSTTRRYGGTGLGLSITRSLVDLMGGTVSVRSRLGQGSVFEAQWPLVEAPGVAQQAAAPAPARAEGAGARLRGLRVLVAEDNGLNRFLLQDMLQAEGAHATLVHHGLALLERIEQDGAQAYDLVLMDVQMPEMDGYETTRRLRVQAPMLPVVGQTAHALPGDREKGLAAGMCDHLTKPFDADQLVATLLRWARPPALDAGVGEGAPHEAPAQAHDESHDPARDEARATPDAPPHEPPVAPPDASTDGPSAGPPDRQPAAPWHDAALTDPQVIDLRVLAARLGQDAGKVQRLAGVFADDTRDVLVQMNEALAQSDARRLQGLAHRVRSSAAAVGAVRFAGLCQQIEELCADQPPERAAPIVATLHALHQVITERLARQARPPLPHPAP